MSSSDTNLLLYTKDTVWSLEAGVGGFVWLQETFPVKLLKIITVITHNNHSFIQTLPRVGNTRRQREMRGGSWLAGKGLGWKPAHTGEVAGPLTHLRWRRLKVIKVGVEQGRSQSWRSKRPQPWSLTIRRRRNSYCACLDSILVYRAVCTLWDRFYV